MTSLRDQVKDFFREPQRPKRNFLIENKNKVHKIEEQNRYKRNNTRSSVPSKSKKYENVPSKVQVYMKHNYGDVVPRQNFSVKNNSTKSAELYTRTSSKKSIGNKALCDEAIQCNEISILSYCTTKDQSTQTEEVTILEEKIIIPSQRSWKSSVENLALDKLTVDDKVTKSQFTQRSHKSNKSSEEQLVNGKSAWGTTIEVPKQPFSEATVSNLPLFKNMDQDVQKLSSDWHEIYHGNRHNELATKSSHKKAEKIDPLRAPSTYQKGVVPRYLKERQEEQVKEAERLQREAPDPDCPPGHIKLSEDVRIKALEHYRKQRDKLIAQLNMLPVHLDTLRSRRQRDTIDKELDEIENLILDFSKPKVFVIQQD